MTPQQQEMIDSFLYQPPQSADELIPCNWESEDGDLCNRISGCLRHDCPLSRGDTPE